MINFLKKLFTKEKLYLKDKDLGEFESIIIGKNITTWKTKIDLFKSPINLYLEGTRSTLNSSHKSQILYVLKDQIHYEKEAEKYLKMLFENAEKPFNIWRNHFKCISLSINKEEIKITYVENASLYNFNIFFINRDIIGSSIDS